MPNVKVFTGLVAKCDKVHVDDGGSSLTMVIQDDEVHPTSFIKLCRRQHPGTNPNHSILLTTSDASYKEGIDQVLEEAQISSESLAIVFRDEVAAALGYKSMEASLMTDDDDDDKLGQYLAEIFDGTNVQLNII